MFFLLIPRRSRKRRRREEQRHQETLAAIRGEAPPRQRPRNLYGWIMRAVKNA